MKNFKAVIAGTMVTLGILGTANAVVALKPAMRGCPSSGYSRLVNVSSSAQLDSALANAQPGDQIRIAAGTYPSNRSIDKSGSASAPITICGVRGTWPIIKNGTFKIRGSYLNISGLVFEGPNNSQNNVGIGFNHDVLFTYNEVRNGDWHAGIAVDEMSNLEISHNYIHDNGFTDIDHGIYYRFQTGRNVIANNVIVGNAGRGISMHDNGGAAIRDTMVVNNTIVGNGSTGVLVAINGGGNNYVANNVLSGNGAIESYKQITMRSGGGNFILNNIVWSSNTSRQGIGIESGAGSNTMQNNLIADPKFVSLSNRDYHLQSGSPALSLANATHATAYDFEDFMRDSAPDSGAFEGMGGPSSTPTPTPIPTPAPPTPTATPASTPTPAPTAPPVPPTTISVLKIPVSADAYVNSAYPTTNRGSKTFLAIDNSPDTRSLLKFTVSGTAGKIIKSVKLRLVPVTSASTGGEVHRLLSSDWTETSVTWKTKPAADSQVLDMQGATEANKAVDFDVTAAVKADRTFSFELRNSLEDGTKYDYAAREKGTATVPMLVITLGQ